MEHCPINYIKQHVSLSIIQEERICSLLHKRTIRKESIVRLHEDDLIAVTSGLLLKIDEDSEKVQHFIAESDIAIYPPSDSPYFLKAIVESQIQYMRHADVMALLEQYSNLHRPYHKMMRFWVQKRMQRAHLLELPAAEAKAAFYRKFGKIAAHIPNKYIASYLNMTPSYFSQL